MKYPFEDVTVLGLIRHPLEENDGDPGSRSYMRLLSLVIFSAYIFCQVHIPIKFFLNKYYVDEAPLLMAILLTITVTVGVFSLYLLCASLIRNITSLYFLRCFRLGYLAIFVKIIPERSKWMVKLRAKLDSARVDLDIAKVDIAGKDLSLGDIVSPSVDVCLVERGVCMYMESLNGAYNGSNIAKLFVTLCKTRVLATDNLAHFYRVLNAQYKEGTWVVQNVIQKSARVLNAQEESERVWQTEIIQNCFPQVNLDELKDK